MTDQAQQPAETLPSAPPKIDEQQLGTPVKIVKRSSPIVEFLLDDGNVLVMEIVLEGVWRAAGRDHNGMPIYNIKSQMRPSARRAKAKR